MTALSCDYCAADFMEGQRCVSSCTCLDCEMANEMMEHEQQRSEDRRRLYDELNREEMRRLEKKGSADV